MLSIFKLVSALIRKLNSHQTTCAAIIIGKLALAYDYRYDHSGQPESEWINLYNTDSKDTLAKWTHYFPTDKLAWEK